MASATRRLKEFLGAPQGIYSVLAVSIGLTLLAVVPPFQVPDEPSHFFRAYQLSRGEWVGKTRAGRESGGMLPVSLMDLNRYLEESIPFHPENKTSVSRILSGFDLPLDPDRTRYGEFSNTVMYSPVCYLPQSIGIAIGRILELPPLALFYLGRLLALAAAVALGIATVWLAPCFKWGFALILLMPMTLFESASLSSDCITNALSFLLVAATLRLAEKSGPMETAELALYLSVVILLSLSKQIYVSLVALFLLVPTSRLGSTGRYWVTLACLVSLALSIGLAWLQVAFGAYHPPRPGVDALGQLAFVLAHPVFFLDLVARSYAENWRAYLEQMIGVLGWLDTHLPVGLHLSYAGALAAAALLDGRPREGGGPGFRLVALGTFLIGLLSIPLSQYLSFNEVGSRFLFGPQGRYFLPFLPVLLLAMGTRPSWRPSLSPAWVRGGFVVFVAGSWASVFRELIERYYGLVIEFR